MATSLFHQLNYRFGVLLRGCGLPRVCFEPINGRRKTLRCEKRCAEILVLWAGEFDMMGKLMQQFAAQGCRGPRHPNHDCLRSRPVFATIIELPRCRQGRRRDAITTTRHRGEKVAPGLESQLAQVTGDCVVKVEVGGTTAATGEADECDQGCREEAAEHIMTITRGSAHAARATK